MTVHRSLQPPGWPRPKGYANGIVAQGRTVWTGGIIGWEQQAISPKIVEPDLVGPQGIEHWRKAAVREDLARQNVVALQLRLVSWRLAAIDRAK